jgi:outer membrane protein W
MNRPERFYNVSQTQLSIARHYGGITFNGADYHYDAESDTLTRMDVWKARMASSKEDADRAARAEREKWTKAQDGFAGF